MKPTVSVLMTTYNREDYLAEAVESVIRSTFADWELIIVDDGSKDGTVALARSFAAKDGRIKVFENETNLGDYPNRNRAASLANGRYLKYVDADDYLYPWGLHVMVEAMERFPEAGWGLCSLEQDRDRPYPFALGPEEIFLHHHFKSSLFHKAPLSAIIRKDVFDAVGGFSGKRQMSDTEMWHNLATRYPLVLMPHGMVWYRIHAGQESSQVRGQLLVRLRYEVSTLHFYESDRKLPISVENRKRIIRRLRRHLYKLILKKIIQFQWRQCLMVIRGLQDHDYDFKTI